MGMKKAKKWLFSYIYRLKNSEKVLIQGAKNK